MVSSRRRESLAGRIDLLIQAMDRLGVRLERASRGPSLATGPAKRMQAAATNEMHTDIAAASVPAQSVRAGRCLDQTAFTPNPTDATVLSVVNGAAFDPGDLVRTSYGKEVMRVRQISGNTLVVDRGFGGTTREALLPLCELTVMGNTTAEASVNKNAILHTVAADSSQTATVPAWKAACTVRNTPRGPGAWIVSSPTKAYWWSLTRNEWRRDYDTDQGAYHSRACAEEAFAACTTPPPDWTEPTITAPEDVIDPSHAAPGRVWYGGPTQQDVENELLCVVPPDRGSYIRPTGKPGRYEQVWHDGTVTPSAFSDGAVSRCGEDSEWLMVYEPKARELVGLPLMSELDHCREA